MIMAADCGSLYERRQSDFIVEKQAVQHHWGDNGKDFSNFLKNTSQPTQRHLKDSQDSFVRHNMINLLSRDQPRIKDTFHKYGYDTLERVCVVGSDESHSSYGLIKDSFTVPESTFSNSTFNTSYIEMCQSDKNYQKEHNNSDINEFGRYFENYYPSSCGQKGWYFTLTL